jgi:hypothetical protein
MKNYTDYQVKGNFQTASGMIRINSKSAYGKWIQGWKDGGGWTGAATLHDAFERAQQIKDSGVSWYMLGKLMASEQSFGRGKVNEEHSEFFDTTLKIINDNDITDEMLKRISRKRVPHKIYDFAPDRIIHWLMTYYKDKDDGSVERLSVNDGYTRINYCYNTEKDKWYRIEYIDGIAIDGKLIE